jgi:hypothetical protein
MLVGNVLVIFGKQPVRFLHLDQPSDFVDAWENPTAA